MRSATPPLASVFFQGSNYRFEFEGASFGDGLALSLAWTLLAIVWVWLLYKLWMWALFGRAGSAVRGSSEGGPGSSPVLAYSLLALLTCLTVGTLIVFGFTFLLMVSAGLRSLFLSVLEELFGTHPIWARVWSWAMALVVPAGVVAGILIFFYTYLGIFQRSQRKLTWGLMAIRGLGLLALLLVVAKPTWTGETQLVDPGRVAIVLDNSESMAERDPSGQTRYARATDALQRLRKTLEANQAGGSLEVDVFDITGAPLDKDKLPDEPTVERTDLTLALSKTSSGLRFKRLNGVVLISDGMDNTDRQDFKDFGRAFGAPIYTAGFGDRRSPDDLDLALKPVRQPPERVMINNDIKVEVLVTKKGGQKADATVVIKRGLDERLTEQQISLPEGDAEQTVSLNLKPAQAGTFEFTVAVESAQPERNLANNSWRFPLRVDADALRVLYLEGFLRYEYKFLKARLEEDPDLNVAALVRRTNPELTDTKGPKDLLTREQLKNFDVVILGDMEATYLSAAEYNALLAWLEDKDKDRNAEHALLLLGGYRSFGPDGFRATRLADALPVVFADQPPYQSEDPFLLTLTEEGRGHPIFEVSSDRVKNAEIWNEAPRLAGCSLVARAKPGAEVLAVNPGVVVNGKPAIVAATQRYGAGRVMVLTVDTTWRWSRYSRVLGKADTLYARFWSQALRWLSGRSASDKRPLLVVNTDQPGYEANKRVKVTVVRQPRPEVDLSKATLRVSYKKLKEATATELTVQASTANPDMFTATFDPSAVRRFDVGGRYEVTASLATEDGKSLGNQSTEFVVHSSSVEKTNTGTTTDTLKALSDSSGGVYRDVANIEEIAGQIPRKERRITQSRHLEFWNSPVLFLFFIGAVATEWFVRRRSHLV
jgi:hypothetical protein